MAHAKWVFPAPDAPECNIINEIPWLYAYCLREHNAESVSNQLDILGVKITERVEYNGAKFFFIRDPDNNVIEFHQSRGK